MIHTISATNYPIQIGAQLYDVATWLPIVTTYHQVVIITDHTVKKHYGLGLQKHLHKKKLNTILLSFPAGEKNKNYQTKQKIENAMLQQRCGKDTLILALGGGVVGDIAGFVAATYMRGIAYIQIPTTLLAMVDSSVGGKTGINTRHGKNLIGSIYQPISVIADTTLLQSLSKKQRINGLIEAIKMFLTHDAKSFCFAETHLSKIVDGDNELLTDIVARAVTIKATVVKKDERELNERNILNFGHTIGHALEKLSNYRLLHGYAIAYGILVESTISHMLGLLSADQLLIIKNLLTRLGIKGSDLKKYDLTQLIQTTKRDKKVRSGSVNYALLQEIGMAHIANNQYVHPVNDNIVRQALKHIAKG
jgi:3-dehydroquinate synthase